MSEPMVKEKDKPFIIAMCFVIGFLAFIFLGAAGVLAGNVPIENYVKDMVGGILGIVGTVVAFYFGTKFKD